jgi:hypothetical protein
MIITMDDFDGESVTKICEEETWMDIIEKVAEGLRGFGYQIPKNREKFLAMLSENMEVNE